MRISNLITTLVLSVFVVLGITGIFLFIEVETDMLEDIHSYLGISFVVLALFHLFNNFSILKNYLKKNKSLMYTIASFFILGFMLVSFALIFGEDEDEDDRGRYELKDSVKYKDGGRFERDKRHGEDDDDDDDDDKGKRKDDDD